MGKHIPLVSIIVPTRTIDSYAKRCIKACKKYCPDAELIVVTDKICAGHPAGKRNYAMRIAKGHIYAFIDSDAYPPEDWMRNALYWLKSFPAVCGPGVLPPDAPFGEKVADQVHKWMFCPYRVIPQSARVVRWHPTFNLIVWKESASQFEDYLTGEDDKFCSNIEEGIFYHPDILVYHNRRGIFKPLWSQFGVWARHKGHFQRLAFVAWLTTLWVYAINFVRVFFKRRLS